MKKSYFITHFLMCALLACTLLLTSCAERNRTWINSSIQGSYSRSKPSLKDDFYQSVNYEWLVANRKLPEDTPMLNRMVDDTQRATAQFMEMLSAPDCLSYEEGLVKQLYSQLMDTQTRDALGAGPAIRIISRIKDIQTIDELWQTAVQDHIPDCTPLSIAYQSVNSQNSNMYLPTVSLKLIFTTDDLSFSSDEEARTTYAGVLKEYLTGLLVKCGWSPEAAEADVNNAYALEQELIGHRYAEQVFIEQKVINPTTARALIPDIPLFNLLEQKGGNYSILCTTDFQSMKNLCSLIKGEDLESLKTYAILSFLLSYGRFLDSECQEQYFVAAQKVNPVKQTVNESYITSVLMNDFDEAICQAWLTRYFSEQTRTEITELTKTIITKYEKRFEEADWISERTKSLVMDKLNTIRFLIGYPTMNDWSEFQLLNSDEDDALLRNIMRIRRQNEAFLISITSELNKKDRWWVMNAMTENAFYDASTHSINICAGILNQIYDTADPIEKKLAGIGIIIGHEISHSFDVNGSTFDKEGTYVNWWDADDYQKLIEKSRLIGTAISDEDSHNDMKDSLLFWGEATADAGAMAVLLDIAADIPDFDYDLFFRHFAESWGVVYTKETAEYLETNDSHPQTFLRVNYTLQLFDKFYETYGIQPGDKMYRKPEERYKVW